MGWKFMVIFYGPKETPEAQELGQEVGEEATSPLGALPPREGAPGLWAPRAPPWRETDAKNSYKCQNPRKEP